MEKQTMKLTIDMYSIIELLSSHTLLIDIEGIEVSLRCLDVIELLEQNEHVKLLKFKRLLEELKDVMEGEGI